MDNLIVALWLLCGSIVILWYLYIKKKHRFWKNLGVPYIPPIVPWGNILHAANPKIHFAQLMKEFYDENKHHGDYVGFYFLTKPAILVTSPEFARKVLTQDFQYFMDRGLYYNERTDPLSASLFSLEGQKWKRIREKVTPTFTSGKMKTMFSTVIGVADRLIEYSSILTENNSIIEWNDILARFTTDVIASCSFGVECNSIFDPDSPFRKVTIKMMSFSKIQSLKMFCTFIFQKQATMLGLRIYHQDVSSYFIKLLDETISERKTFGNNRKDFLQLLLQLHTDGRLEEDIAETDETDKLTFLEIAAQCFIFLFAGFETSSTTMSIALHHLALDQDLQTKARNEINELYDKYDGKLTYESCMEMDYLEKIIYGMNIQYTIYNYIFNSFGRLMLMRLNNWSTFNFFYVYI